MKPLAEFERRFLDGDARALRAVVRQASRNTLTHRMTHVLGSGASIEGAPFAWEVRAAGDSGLVFTGYACVVEEPYEMCDWIGDYTEIVRDGAFSKTLSESPDVIFVLNHDWSAAPMARTVPGTLRLSADSTGLMCEASLDASRADVHIMRSALERGELDAMSFAFRVTRQTWSPDYDQRDIHEVNLAGGDTSVVTFPANPATTGTTALRKEAANAVLRSGIPAYVAAELRAGKSLSAATMDTLQEVLDLVASADDAVDEAQLVLSSLMGVPNPDDDAATSAPVAPDQEAVGAAPAADAERLAWLAERADIMRLAEKGRVL